LPDLARAENQDPASRPAVFINSLPNTHKKSQYAGFDTKSFINPSYLYKCSRLIQFTFSSGPGAAQVDRFERPRRRSGGETAAARSTARPKLVVIIDSLAACAPVLGRTRCPHIDDADNKISDWGLVHRRRHILLLWNAWCNTCCCRSNDIGPNYLFTNPQLSQAKSFHRSTYAAQPTNVFYHCCCRCSFDFRVLYKRDVSTTPRTAIEQMLPGPPANTCVNGEKINLGKVGSQVN